VAAVSNGGAMIHTILILTVIVLVLQAELMIWRIAGEVKKIMATEQEIVAQLAAQKAQVDKVLAEIEALKALVNGTQNVPQAIVDAVAALGASIQAADDANPDAPVV